MKNLDKAKQPHKVASAGKKKPFLLAVFFLCAFQFNTHAQKLIYNAVDGKINAQDTAMLTRLVKYEAYFYNGLFEKQIPDSLLVIINLYKSRKKFEAVRDAESASITKTGFYSGRTKQCYIYEGDDYTNVIVHEVSHLFMLYHNYYGVPNWINEGLAEFFEGLYINDNNAVYVDQQTPRLRKLKEYISKGELDLKKYFGPEMSSWANKQDIEFKYNVGYGIIFFIIKTHPEYIKQILASLNKGDSSFTALAGSYGSFESFESRFRAFYR